MRSAYTATVDLPPVQRSVPAARRVITELLTAWAAQQYREDAVLLVSELVTNVLRHAPEQVGLVLQIDLSEPCLRVSVADGEPTHPTMREPDPTEPGGHGLWLIAALAHRWGSEDHPYGKRVWFELRHAAA